MSKKTLAVAFAVSVVVIACTAEGPTTPPQTETLVRAPEPVVSATPIPAPRAVDPTPEPGSAFVLKFYDNAGFELFYNGGASYAGVTASITNFDDQDTPLPVPGYSDGIVPYTVASGSSWNYSFNRQCVQLDIDQPGIKLIAAAFFDKQGKQFNPSYGADKIAECRRGTPTPPPCKEDEDPSTTYGQYSWSESILEGKCEQEVLPIVYEDTVAPALNCHQTGSQGYTTDLKCSDDRTGTRNLCRNVACPTPPPTCRDYEAPSTTVTGTPATGALGFTGIGTVLPTGGTFTPGLPLLGIQPEYGSPAVVLSTTYSKAISYGPENLQCSVTASKEFTFTLQPKTCDVSNPPAFWDQSETDNNNKIDFNTHVRNSGTWVLTMYAASSITKYNNNTPDYTKATDTKTLQCRGEGELKVSYTWKDHPSEYWWAVLTRNGVVLWKSSYVQNYTN